MWFLGFNVYEGRLKKKPIGHVLKAAVCIFRCLVRMNGKNKLIFVSGVFFDLFFIILALNVKILWVSIVCGTAFIAYLAMELYLLYHYKHSKKQEKHRMQSQKPARHYYYDRWYTPADSTQLENEADKVKKRKNHIVNFFFSERFFITLVSERLKVVWNWVPQLTPVPFLISK